MFWLSLVASQLVFRFWLTSWCRSWINMCEWRCLLSVRVGGVFLIEVVRLEHVWLTAFSVRVRFVVQLEFLTERAQVCVLSSREHCFIKRHVNHVHRFASYQQLHGVGSIVVTAQPFARLCSREELCSGFVVVYERSAPINVQELLSGKLPIFSAQFCLFKHDAHEFHQCPGSSFPKTGIVKAGQDTFHYAPRHWNVYTSHLRQFVSVVAI